MSTPSSPTPNKRRAAGLRQSLRRWRFSMFMSVAILVVCGLILYEARRSSTLHWMWLVLGSGGMLLYSVRLVAQVYEYRKTQRSLQAAELGEEPP